MKKHCRRDFRREITGITATFDFVETWTEGGSYGGGTLTAGQSVTRTYSGTHTFERIRVGDFIGLPFQVEGDFVENSKLAKCGASYYDFCNTLDPEDRKLVSGTFVLWATGCCQCDITLDPLSYPIADGIETTLDGFGGADGTTTDTLHITLPFYVPRHCKKDARLPWSYVASATEPTFTITHAVAGDSTTPAEQLISLDAAGIIDGSGEFHWVGPDGKTYKFALSPQNGEAETRTHHARLPTLDYVDSADATDVDRANFQITLEDGPSNSYGSFRIAFVGKFANQAVNLITYYEDSVPGFTTRAIGSAASDKIYVSIAGENIFADVARCGAGDSWEIDMGKLATGYIRTGTLTFDFIY